MTRDFLFVFVGFGGALQWILIYDSSYATAKATCLFPTTKTSFKLLLLPPPLPLPHSGPLSFLDNSAPRRAFFLAFYSSLPFRVTGVKTGDSFWGLPRRLYFAFWELYGAWLPYPMVGERGERKETQELNSKG